MGMTKRQENDNNATSVKMQSCISGRLASRKLVTRIVHHTVGELIIIDMLRYEKLLDQSSSS